jgi:hypothetical protein
MDAGDLARWTRRVQERLNRRNLIDLGAGAGLAAILGLSTDVSARKRKKKKKPVQRCAAFGQACASDASCCDQTGKVICEIVWDDNFDKANCPDGDFCCGLAGVPCTSHCDCCGYMRCLQTSTGATCQAY